MIRGILFDLDGTLADTAPDLGGALNDLLSRYGRDPMPHEVLRPLASSGARGMVLQGFGLTPADPYFEELRDEYLECYAARLVRDSVLFPGVEQLLASLDNLGLPWGIVTNKFTRFAEPLIAQMPPLNRTACLVCGDTYERPKPFPDPLIGAATLLNLPAASLLYVGDDERDMVAAQAAGMHGVVARYGYLGNGAPPEDWPAQHHIDAPGDLLSLINT
jgi:N-acetyl-D-muramate 6-phosphate phosphatase